MACPAHKRSRDCVARQVPVGTSSTPKQLCRVQRGEYRQIRVRSRELVRNAGQVYLVDEDFGPLFVKFCSYFPYNAKVCLNGHEYVKRQLARRGTGFEALDNVIVGGR